MKTHKSALFILVMASQMLCCNRQKSEIDVSHEPMDQVFVGQSLMWYQSAIKIRNKYKPTNEIDVEILKNYFPLFLAEKRRGCLNQQRLRLASLIYADDHGISGSVWNISRSSFETAEAMGILESVGFNPEDIKSYEEFQKARERYFSVLERNSPDVKNK